MPLQRQEIVSRLAALAKKKSGKLYSYTTGGDRPAEDVSASQSRIQVPTAARRNYVPQKVRYGRSGGPGSLYIGGSRS